MFLFSDSDYIDRSLSGKNMERPALQRLINDVTEEKINLILASELSRISRNMRDFLSFWDLLKEHKCGFSSLRENVDTSNAAGEMVLRTIVNIAQFEREQTRERILANTKARSQRGFVWKIGPRTLWRTWGNIYNEARV